MPDTQPRNYNSSNHLLGKQDPARLARHMIKRFGSAAAGKALEMVRAETTAQNQEAARRWHQVMSLIEDSQRKPRL